MGRVEHREGGIDCHCPASVAAAGLGPIPMCCSHPQGQAVCLSPVLGSINCPRKLMTKGHAAEPQTQANRIYISHLLSSRPGECGSWKDPRHTHTCISGYTYLQI